MRKKLQDSSLRRSAQSVIILVDKCHMISDVNGASDDERMDQIMKKFWFVLRVIVIVSIIGIVAYKAYEYFTKDDMLEDGEDDFDVDAFGEEPETLAGKIKAAAKKVVG